MPVFCVKKRGFRPASFSPSLFTGSLPVHFLKIFHNIIILKRFCPGTFSGTCKGRPDASIEKTGGQA